MDAPDDYDSSDLSHDQHQLNQMVENAEIVDDKIDVALFRGGQ